MIIDSIKTAYNVLKENMMLLQPLILYVLLIGFITSPIRFSLNQDIPSIIAIFTSIMSFIAFYAGWTYMIKIAVSNKNTSFSTPEEKGLAQIDLLKKFFTGVGEYFLPVLGYMFIYILLFALIFFAAYQFGLKTISSFDIIKELPKYLAMDSSQLYKTLTSDNLPMTSQIIFLKWSLLFFVAGSLHTFLTVFYMPTILFKTKNPFVAFCKNFIFIFKNFFEVIAVLIFLTALQIIFSLLSVPANLNIIISILYLFVMFFYATFNLMLLFVYYDFKNENNSNSGTDSIG